VLVGAGQDTTVVFAFFPSFLRVRVGDTVTWRMNDDDLHTVTFAAGTRVDPQAGGVQDPLGPGGSLIPALVVPRPGGGPGEAMLNPQVAFATRAPGAPVETYSGSSYANSGILSKLPAEPGAPPNDTFSLRFDTPGNFPYVSIILADRMVGTIQVVPAGTPEVPDQAAIDAAARTEMAALLGVVQEARGQGQALARSEAGPADSTLWYVRAGNSDFHSGDLRAQSMDYLPRDITVRAGDTVIWGSSLLHTVTFAPVPPLPDFVVPVPQPAGPPQLTINPRAAPAKPSAVFEPTQYFNSGLLGPLGTDGFSWALTFEQPGTFEYACIVHGPLGMKGTVTVVPQ
jgi:plastocyanin